jgi:hypothetical protein
MVHPAQPDPKAGPATPTELLDRTGIIAASLPQRRRVELGPKPEAVTPVPEAHTETLRPKATDLRPREVVIRRRSRGWLATGAGVVLVAIGWFGGGMFGVHSGGETVQAEVQQNAVATQPAPVVQQPAAPVAPPIAVAPVPTPHRTIHHIAAPKTPSHPKPASAAPRVDLPSTPAPTPATDPVAVFNQRVQNMLAPFMQMMGTH